jgi:hypothetical protein
MWSFVMRRVRLYRPDGNPLRRRWDRIEAVVVVILILLAVASLPLTLALGTRVLSLGTAQVSAGHWINAQLVADAPPGTTSAYRVVYPSVTVRWQEDGQVLTAPAPVRWGMRAGDRVKLWMDEKGVLAAAPPDQVELTLQAVMAGLVVFFAACTALGGMYGVARWALDRRRAAAWDEDWVTADARWRGQKR